MCGICGIAYRDRSRPVEHGRLIDMREALAHRGPDGSGLHCYGATGLGHRRLSIIDLDGGAQPLSNEDGTVWVSFNGEIYNYRELTERLLARGHRFRTRSDTEVIVHAYEEYGVECAAQLNGMFAFAVHDTRRRRVLLARDQLGVKPLFYSVSSEGLFFASEIKAILAALGQRPGVHAESLKEYLIFRYVAWNRTFFDGIRRLPPGHWALWEDGRLDVRRYWAPRSPATSEPRGLAAAVEELDEHLDRAVTSQLMSEVPLGTFCSGGVDSGLVTGYAARNRSSSLHTFSVGFREPAWDETELAEDSAARFETEHRTIVTDARELLELLPRLVSCNDEPLSHPNSVPIFVLSRFARGHVTVVLTGEGADELFCGYPRYHIARLNGLLSGLPDWTRDGIGRMATLIPSHRGALVGRLIPRSTEEAILLNSSYVDPQVVERLTGESVGRALDERRALLEECRVTDDPIGTISRYELQTYLGCALERMDRMSMAVGLEGRVPFLDVPLVEWALRLPSRFKIGARSNKVIVKRLASRSLSPRITRGRKSGFGLPLSDWFRDPRFGELIARLRDPRHPAADHFDRRALSAVVERHLSGEADNSQALWLLLNVYLWYETQTLGANGDGLSRRDTSRDPRGLRPVSEP